MRLPSQRCRSPFAQIGWNIHLEQEDRKLSPTTRYGNLYIRIRIDFSHLPVPELGTRHGRISNGHEIPMPCRQAVMMPCPLEAGKVDRGPHVPETTSLLPRKRREAIGQSCRRRAHHTYRTKGRCGQLWDVHQKTSKKREVAAADHRCPRVERRSSSDEHVPDNVEVGGTHCFTVNNHYASRFPD